MISKIKDRYGAPLSVRELQIVKLICRAKTNKEIGYLLGLTEGTVKEYLFRVFHKTGATSRMELSVWAADHRRKERLAAAKTCRMLTLPLASAARKKLAKQRASAFWEFILAA